MANPLELLCRGCSDPITDANRSEAHVIPNALGGNLKTSAAICRVCNTELDRIADNALVEAFGSWPTLLDIPRDRGSNPPRSLETQQGKRVRLDADGRLTKTDVRYDVSPSGDGHLVEIEAGDWKTFRQLLARAQKQFSQFDPKSAETFAREVAVCDDDALRLSLDFSPEAVFGGAITAIWLYLIMTTGCAFMDWVRLLDVIGNTKNHGGTLRYYTKGLPGLTGPDVPLGHKLIVRSVPKSGKLIAYVEILEVLRIGGVFAEAPPPAMALEHIHVYDVLGRRERSKEFNIDVNEFEAQDWPSVGLSLADAEALRAHHAEEMKRVFAARYYKRFEAEGGSA